MGDGDDGQDDEKPEPVASSTSDMTVRDASMLAFRSVVSVLEEPDQAQACLPESLVRRAIPTRSGVLVSWMLADQPSLASLAASSTGE